MLTLDPGAFSLPDDARAPDSLVTLQAERIRFSVRVKPRSRVDRVGGSWGERSILVVAVQAPAVDGKANQAVTTVLARVLGVPKRHLTIVAGGDPSRVPVELAPASVQLPDQTTKLIIARRATADQAQRP